MTQTASKKPVSKKRKSVRGAEGDRAARILESADALFCEQGFEGVSLRDVAEKADVNKALILYYYKSKAGLFATVLEGYYASHASVLEGAMGFEGPFRERVHALLDGYFDFMEANRRYTRLIQQEIARASEHLPIIRKSLTLLAALVEAVLSEGLPATGPLARKHFFLTFSAMMINYFTYAPALSTLWGEDPLSQPALDERRAHVHWVVECMLEGLERT